MLAHTQRGRIAWHRGQAIQLKRRGGDANLFAVVIVDRRKRTAPNELRMLNHFMGRQYRHGGNARRRKRIGRRADAREAIEPLPDQIG